MRVRIGGRRERKKSLDDVITGGVEEVKRVEMAAYVA